MTQIKTLNFPYENEIRFGIIARKNKVLFICIKYIKVVAMRNLITFVQPSSFYMIRNGPDIDV